MPGKFQRQGRISIRFISDDGMPYANTKYIARFLDGTKKEGVTDCDGYSESFNKEKEESVKVDLLLGYH